MTKITPEHLARIACVYIRQSTADQLAHNHESRRRQYGLVDRAKQLGWSNVEVIDDDLGARAAVSRVLASSGCSRRSATAVSVPCSRSRRRALPVMAATGTR
jgi:hypothetical protein